MLAKKMPLIIGNDGTFVVESQQVKRKSGLRDKSLQLQARSCKNSSHK